MVDLSPLRRKFLAACETASCAELTWARSKGRSLRAFAEAHRARYSGEDNSFRSIENWFPSPRRKRASANPTFALSSCSDLEALSMLVMYFLPFKRAIDRAAYARTIASSSCSCSTISDSEPLSPIRARLSRASIFTRATGSRSNGVEPRGSYRFLLVEHTHALNGRVTNEAVRV